MVFALKYVQLAQMCQKEMRREAIRSQKVAMQTAPRARRLAREVCNTWITYMYYALNVSHNQGKLVSYCWQGFFYDQLNMFYFAKFTVNIIIKLNRYLLLRHWSHQGLHNGIIAWSKNNSSPKTVLFACFKTQKKLTGTAKIFLIFEI